MNNTILLLLLSLHTVIISAKNINKKVKNINEEQHPNSVYSQLYKHSKPQSSLKIFYQSGVSFCLRLRLAELHVHSAVVKVLTKVTKLSLIYIKSTII